MFDPVGGIRQIVVRLHERRDEHDGRSELGRGDLRAGEVCPRHSEPTFPLTRGVQLRVSNESATLG